MQLNRIFLFCFVEENKNKQTNKKAVEKMDVLPMCSIFQELQIVHDTGYFSALPSLEEYWQQVNIFINCSLSVEAELSTLVSFFSSFFLFAM